MRLVTCHDGEQCDSSSERWRAECEARSLSRLSHPSRKAALEVITLQRGEAAAEQLRRLVLSIAEARAAGTDKTRTE